MRRISSQGLELIKRFEGFSATPYRCPAGYMTIGYGHLIRTGEHYERVTPEIAERLLHDDVEYAESAVSRLIGAPLTQGQFDALVSFTFNLGPGALQRSSLRQKILRREYSAAAAEFSRWVYAGGIKINGLVARRCEERRLFLSRGEY